MQSFSSLLLTIYLALLVSSVSSSPVKRADDVVCEDLGTAFLTLQTKLSSHGAGSDNPYIAVGLSTPDKTGATSRFLTTKRSDGKSLDANFSFYSCDSKHMNYHTKTVGLGEFDHPSVSE